jgi:hypothetical protein
MRAPHRRTKANCEHSPKHLHKDDEDAERKRATGAFLGEFLERASDGIQQTGATQRPRRPNQTRVRRPRMRATLASANSSLGSTSPPRDEAIVSHPARRASPLDSAMPLGKRDILGAVRTLSEQAAKADALVDEAIEAGLDGSHPITVHTKMLRLELLKTKAALERELGRLVLNCSRCWRRVHWVSGLAVEPGHWAHSEPAPNHEPVV